MKKLVNLEFYSTPQGEIEVNSPDGVYTYLPEQRNLTDQLFSVIQEDYPEAFAGLSESYAKSASNVPWFKYQVVHRFLRCNFGRYDKDDDIDASGRMRFENVDCPVIRECKYHNIICNPKYNTRLTAREYEVMKLYYEGFEAVDIANRLGISDETVKTLKRNAFTRLGVHSMNEFQILARKNNLFSEAK